MPRIEDIISKLNDARYFSTIDYLAGYHHIPLDEDSNPKLHLHLLLKIPVGLGQALAYFQELMNKVLKDLSFTTAYLDDIMIYSKTAEEYLDYLQEVFYKLHDTEVAMKLSNCHFFAKEIQYLGHVLSTTGIKPQPSKQQLLSL